VRKKTTDSGGGEKKGQCRSRLPLFFGDRQAFSTPKVNVCARSGEGSSGVGFLTMVRKGLTKAHERGTIIVGEQWEEKGEEISWKTS